MKSVFVTGTPSGIGRAGVQHLAGQGWLVFAGVRNRADSEALAAEPGASGTRCPVGRGVRTLVSVRPPLPDFAYDRLSAIISS